MGLNDRFLSDYSKYGIRSLLMLMTRGPWGKRLNDETFLKLRYYAVFGKRLNLKNPKTYNEKLQWIKLYDRKPIYNRLVDKYEVKKYVEQIIGKEYIIPTLGVWNSFDEIDFNILPRKFVLKCTHDSGGLVICKDKYIFNKGAAKKRINASLNNNFYYTGREWPYKNVKPRIIAEQYMEDKETRELRDYKFFTFNGEVKALFIATDRGNPNVETKFDFFDTEFNHLHIINGHPNATTIPKRPVNFELMKELASELSRGLSEARIDFYEVNGSVFFGEITLFHWSGLVPFEPSEWDVIFGNWIKLPETKR